MDVRGGPIQRGFVLNIMDDGKPMVILSFIGSFNTDPPKNAFG